MKPVSRIDKFKLEYGPLLGLWLFLRLTTSIWAAMFSMLRPLTDIERLIPLWPPTMPFHKWLYRVLLAPWQRWDVEWHLRILTEGYQAGNGTDAFHPLYPWLAYPLTRLGVDPLLALMVVSNLATLAFLFLFVRMVEWEAGPAQAQTASQWLLFFPLTFILFAPYNEGLFLLLSALTLLCARQRKWWWAGISGALAVLTRQQGILLVFPFIWELWEAHKGDARRMLRSWRCWLAIGLIPLALALWALYRALVIGGGQLSFASPYALVYSMLISSSADQVGGAYFIIWPWQAVYLALMRLGAAPDVDLIVNLTLGVLFLIVVFIAWPHLPASYRVYTLVTVLISFSYHTGMTHPYQGLPRHLFLAFPVFMGAGHSAWLSRRRLLWAGGGFAGSCFLILLYILETWVP
ncbi:MAG TPA: glycosyltransferase family 39 protein [Anaerolineae bacterium]|nr:glycosyltransferase family 39 protein [Anaerolineae bacterium]